MQDLETKPELVFWLDAPPRSVAGALRHVAQEWGSPVHYLCVRPLSEERKAMGWEDCDHGKAVLTILSEQSDPDRFVQEFIRDHVDAIHMCNGFRSLAAPYFRKWLLPDPKVKAVAWSERPGVYENRIEQLKKRLCVSVLNRYFAFRYGRNIQAYLPIGTLGVESFARFGWDRNILFPFMYDSHIPVNYFVAKPRQSGAPLRLLYVGQFGWRKGIDVLQKAVGGLRGDWRLDLVGKNGAYEQQIVAWANEHPRVSYLGFWPSSEVVRRTAQYDLCLVPSRFDGWGLFTNEAIHAGVGVIVSDAVASCDLVRASGAGRVVPAGNVRALMQAIQQVLDEESLTELWKARARTYAPRIASETVGQYLMDVLDYVWGGSTRLRPQCPWLQNGEPQ